MIRELHKQESRLKEVEAADRDLNGKIRNIHVRNWSSILKSNHKDWTKVWEN
jgi:hypothetical protein